MEKLVFMITFRVKEEHVEAFETQLKLVKEELPAVEGCNGVSVFRHSEEGTVFTLVEEWEGKVYHARHVDGLVAAGAWAEIETMLEEAPNGRYMTRL
ncbi:putative quinol monooxygenase [Pelagibius sp. Alg239-R121]|uniref:putative quinol monooxygenase n=1 Tax=Pelagibius sp. Alg239-R121 TaxID=2993448 RepID=UPI0024A6C25E|nr:antibiotic biosynthesis monooxygenase family protein [Pelagibius sp. Alg239-R121]